MITRLNVASIYVLDKEEALDFYVNKLGLEKGSDVRPGRLPLADRTRAR
jgi:catechol 2,3-dioxygenase-like lactoylglutathione lyase family enzyme